jgi:hypothetical protein
MNTIIDDIRNSQSTRQRKADQELRLDYFQDNQLENLWNILSQDFSNPEKLQPCFVNIVKKITNLRAQVYVEEASRTIEGSESDKELFAVISEHAQLDNTLKTASKLTKLLKTCLLRVVFRNGRLDLDLLPSHLVDVWVGDSPKDLEAVLVCHPPENGREENTTYSYWTSQEWQRLDYRGRVIESGPNPYKCLPFVPLWDSVPLTDFWLPGGDDLVAIQEAINSKLTDLLHVVRFQGFGVGWLRGGEGGGSVQADPGAFIELPEGGELGFASPDAPIAEIVQVIDQLLKWAAVSNGLPASSLSTEPTDESGISKLVSNSELSEMRRDDIALFRQYEKQLFHLIRIVWNVHNAKKLSEAATITIDFADPKPDTSDSDKANAWKSLMELGVIGPVDVVMERNPDITTRDEALEYLLQVKVENDKLMDGVL